MLRPTQYNLIYQIQDTALLADYLLDKILEIVSYNGVFFAVSRR
nr:MAG TPA: hypothetical protein [Caudoviricetes sp.]